MVKQRVVGQPQGFDTVSGFYWQRDMEFHVESAVSITAA